MGAKKGLNEIMSAKQGLIVGKEAIGVQSILNHVGVVVRKKEGNNEIINDHDDSGQEKTSTKN